MAIQHVNRFVTFDSLESIYTFNPDVSSFPSSPTILVLLHMDPTAFVKPRAPLFETMAQSREPPATMGLSSSIWAPQPQPSDTAWSKAIDSINRANEYYVNDLRPELRRAASHPTGRNGEDVFGPVGFLGNLRHKDVGAIGDGRKKSSPEFGSIHVEQLLRTLNLNSPAPFSPSSAPGEVASSCTSADVSPISTTSGLHTPPDISPVKGFSDWKFNPTYDFGPVYQTQPHNALLFETEAPFRYQDVMGGPHGTSYPTSHSADPFPPRTTPFPFFEPLSERPSPAPLNENFSQSECATPAHYRQEPVAASPGSWGRQRLRTSSADWMKPEELRIVVDHSSPHRSSDYSPRGSHGAAAHEPINFLSLLHPSSAPPYHLFVARIIKSSDQQASIFLQQKLKVADAEERGKIVDAICSRGFEMMAHRGKVVDLATNCYGCHVLQKALDCEEDVRLLIVSELLLGDPAQTLVNKHASHVWSKIMELSWTPPAPPIFAYVNRSLKGKWASLACHETGSLVVQHAFENLEKSAKDGIVDELLSQGAAVFSEVAKNQWGSYCIQHILEHGSTKHRNMALDHLISGLLEYATNEQGSKSVTKALKEGGKETQDRVIKRMCEPAQGLIRTSEPCYTTRYEVTLSHFVGARPAPR
ncbi:hypothetical protein PHLCEN_2v12080 [Hermanssonia centrifuga]|uniref:PUM-HD domain-containing protein n=1 Tax=Hermanssonia centrifuga TaxID=98765 RepID=A0A2R6NI69_9APHY|nr:hypothetical protein PHLCEN_2v12080 [Hermanssonia centrifuga]